MVGSEAAGTVEKILVDLGDRVEAGDVMAIVDQREAELNIRDSAATFDSAEKTVLKELARKEDSAASLKRYEELYKEALVSQAQFDGVKTQSDVAAASYNEALSRLEGAKARLSMSKKKFSDTVLKAPISGEVSKRYTSLPARLSRINRLSSGSYHRAHSSSGGRFQRPLSRWCCRVRKSP